MVLSSIGDDDDDIWSMTVNFFIVAISMTVNWSW